MVSDSGKVQPIRVRSALSISLFISNSFFINNSFVFCKSLRDRSSHCHQKAMAGSKKKPRSTQPRMKSTSKDEDQTFWSRAFAPLLLSHIMSTTNYPSFTGPAATENATLPVSATPVSRAQTHSSKNSQSEVFSLAETARATSAARHNGLDGDNDDNDDDMPNLDNSDDDAVMINRTSSNEYLVTRKAASAKQSSAPTIATSSGLNSTHIKTKSNPKGASRPRTVNTPSRLTEKAINEAYATIDWKVLTIIWTGALVLSYMLVKGLWLLIWLLQWALWVVHTTVEGGQTLLTAWYIQLGLVVLWASYGVKFFLPWYAFKVALGEAEFVMEL